MSKTTAHDLLKNLGIELPEKIELIRGSATTITGILKEQEVAGRNETIDEYNKALDVPVELDKDKTKSFLVEHLWSCQIEEAEELTQELSDHIGELMKRGER